jgi:hypothetical protein
MAVANLSAHDELAEVWANCRTPGWDGYGALAVEPETHRQACRLLQALPAEAPPTSVGAEPDGHVTLEWYRDPRWLLSVSVSPTGMLHYAALFGAGDVRGAEPFADEVPELVLHLIRRMGAE